MALTLHPLSSKLTSTKHCSIVPSIKFSRPTCHRRIAVGASQTSNATASSTAAAPVVPPTDEALQQRIASVEVDLGAAVERVTVPLTDPNSRLLQATMQFPLGLVIENVDGEPVLTEVAAGGPAAAADCRVGDVVRATTAMTMQMTYPTMNLIFGGVGRPKLVKLLLPTSRVPFAKVLDAVRSNSTSEGGDGSVTLVLERVGQANEQAAAPGSRDSIVSKTETRVEEGLVTVGVAGTAAGATAAEDDGTVFDPKIFE